MTWEGEPEKWEMCEKVQLLTRNGGSVDWDGEKLHEARGEERERSELTPTRASGPTARG